MKICLIQPPYANDGERADELFAAKIRELDACDGDLIVLPEYSDVPFAPKNGEEAVRVHERYFPELLAHCRAAAIRCGATVFFNALDPVDGQFRNTTFVLDRNGEIVGKYYKRHIPPAERALGVAYDYTLEPDGGVTTVTADGVKYAFLTCYDFYFYEAYPRIALEKPDVIIGCSLQRSDPHPVSELFCRFLAYNTNAYVVRCSVSYAEDSGICGASCVTAPDGNVLLNMKGKFGTGTVEIDPKKKFYKPAGFGRTPTAHYEYMEEGRMPWQYRPCGPGTVPDDRTMTYPRLCAHRGFNSVAPENSLPAFGAAVALGADEIEFDLWASKDGVLVSCHDRNLDRVSDGTGFIDEKTFSELKELDFGVKTGDAFRGLTILTFEEILRKFARRTVMNIHVKIWDWDLEEDHMEEIVALIRKYDCAGSVYFMTVNDRMLEKVGKYAPDIHRCVGHDENRPYEIVNRAIALGAEKVQLFKPYFNQEMIDLAHRNHIICNVFYADTEEEIRAYSEMGIDTILTNDYQRSDRFLRSVNPAYAKRKER